MSRSLIHILRDTLEQMERSSDCAPDDPAMQKLREEITETVIRLEISKTLAECPESAIPAPKPAQTKAA